MYKAYFMVYYKGIMSEKLNSKSIYVVGCLCEYGNLDNFSLIEYSFNEALDTCSNKTFDNVCSRSCKILRKLLKNFSNTELLEKADIKYYIDYYKTDRNALIEKVIDKFASSFIVKYREWEEQK